MERKHVTAGAAAILIGAVMLFGGCGDDDSGPHNQLRAYDASVAIAWFDLLNDIVKTEGLSTPAAARIYGYAGVTLYESVVDGSEIHSSLVGQLNGLTELPRADAGSAYHWPTVASSALADVSRRLLAGASEASLDAIDSLEDSLANVYSAGIGHAVFERSVAYGHEVGEAVYEWAFDDTYPTFAACAYTPPQGTGLWVPTPPDYLAALEPCWGELRLMSLSLPEVCQPVSPLPYDENPLSPFYAQAQEVHDSVDNLTAEQEEIALFWADEPGSTSTLAGHWFSILNLVADSNEFTLDVAAEAYARVGIALSDATISCWRTKYAHSYIRPVSAIQDFLDASWMPFLTTPPTPEYTAEHAVQSAAAAQVLTMTFGHLPFVDLTHEDAGLASRTFTSFFDAVDEVGVSRLYGGVDFRFAIETGREQGICVGEHVMQLQMRLEPMP